MIRVINSIPTDQIKLLIFDLDGTLVDSELDLAHAINAMLRHYSRPELPVDVIGSYIGDGAPMLVRRSLGDPQDEHFVQEALLYFMKYYREHKLDNTYAYKGIPEALHALREHSNGRLKMTVLTNKPIGPSQGIIEGLGMKEHFIQVYGGNSFETKKPDPLGALKLLEETATKPNEAVMIGDSQNDILTARNVGMWCLGVTYGFAPETLVKHPPDILIDEPTELVPALLGASHLTNEHGELSTNEGFVS